MKQLKLSIKPKQEPNDGQCLRSSGYSVKINDWELGRGVIDFKLEMSADKKPKATVTFTPDVIDVDEMMAVKEVQMKDNLVGKYLEISGEIAGQIAAEGKDTLLIRKTIVDKELVKRENEELETIISHLLLTEKAVYLSKNYLDNYWVKTVELSNIPVTVNVIDSVVLINKLFGM